MGILSRFADLMKANLNTVLEKTEGKNADKLLEQYIREARKNLDTVKSETAGVIAEEMAAGRRVASFDEEIAKLAGYAEKAVLAGNDDDAKKFLAGKDAAEGKKADAERAYAQAQLNSDRMRQLTKKLGEDIEAASAKLDELKGKLGVAKQQERMNELSDKMAGLTSETANYKSLAEAVQKRIDTVDAKAQINAELNESGDLDSLKEKYTEAGGSDTAKSSLDDELAALKLKLGK